jgi:hypothetical protein
MRLNARFRPSIRVLYLLNPAHMLFSNYHVHVNETGLRQRNSCASATEAGLPNHAKKAIRVRSKKLGEGASGWNGERHVGRPDAP